MEFFTMGHSKALVTAIQSGISTEDLILFATGAKDESTRQAALDVILSTRIRQVCAHSNLWQIYFKPGHPSFEKVAKAIIQHTDNLQHLEKVLIHSRDLDLRHIAWSQILVKVNAGGCLNSELFSLQGIPAAMQRGICIVGMKSSKRSLHTLNRLKELCPDYQWEDHLNFQGLELHDLIAIMEDPVIDKEDNPHYSLAFCKKSFQAVFARLNDGTYQPKEAGEIGDFFLNSSKDLSGAAKELLSSLARFVLSSDECAFNSDQRAEDYPFSDSCGWGCFYRSMKSPTSRYLRCIYGIALSPLVSEEQKGHAITILRENDGLVYRDIMLSKFVNLSLVHPVLFDEIFSDDILSQLIVDDLQKLAHRFKSTQPRLLAEIRKRSASQVTNGILKKYST